MDGINTLRYSDLFLAMYFDGGKSCLHRNHSHVLVYVYSGEMVIDEKGQITRLHKGECAFIRKDFSVQMTKQAWNGEQFKAIFLMFTMKFLRDFYSKLDRNTLPKDAKRDQVSLYKLPSNRPDIVSLFESMTPYFNSKIQNVFFSRAYLFFQLSASITQQVFNGSEGIGSLIVHLIIAVAVQERLHLIHRLLCILDRS